MVRKWALEDGLIVAAATEGLAFANRIQGVVAVAHDGRPVWQRPEGASFLLPTGELLLYESGRRPVHHGVDPASGKVLWSYTGVIGPSCVLDERHCVALGAYNIKRGEAELMVATLPPSPRPVWWRRFVCQAPPGLPFERVAVAGSRLLVLDQQREREHCVLSLSATDGSEAWMLALQDHGVRANRGSWEPHVFGGTLLFRLDDGIASVDVASGSLRWKVRVAGQPGFSAERVALASGSRLTVLDVADGRMLFTEDAGKVLGRNNEFTSAPVVSDTHVFVGDDSGTLWAFELETGTAVWSDRPEETVGHLRAPTVFNGHLYMGDYTMDPRRPMHLYCWEPVQGCVARPPAPLAVEATEVAEENPTAFRIEAVMSRRQLTTRSPYHAAGGEWTVYRCRMRDGGAAFCFGDRVKRGAGAPSGAQGALWVESTDDADKLLRLFRKATGLRGPRGAGAAVRVKGPTFLVGVNLSGAGKRQVRKWSTPDGDCELLVEWDAEAGQGGFIEKDDVHRREVVDLIAGLAVRKAR